MRVVLDTNVLVSGIFFGGVPGRILSAWAEGAPPLDEPVSDDPADDMFLAAAFASHVPIVVSGDRDLLRVSGWRGIAVLTPRQFHDQYISGR